jgi:flagellum-specific peptidoglycan hydrolase FlgJ
VEKPTTEGTFSMLLRTRRLLTAPLLVAAIGAGLVTAPAAANAAGVAATVTVTGTLKVRSAPALAARIVGSVSNRQRITVQCVVAGTSVHGSVRTTNLWDRLSTGHYLSHAYVKAARTIPRCAVPSPQAVPVKAKPAPVTTAKAIVGTVRSADGSVNLRTGPSTAAAVASALASGAKVTLVCAANGTTVSGTVRTTSQWDRTDKVQYVSHAYVESATLPLCAGSTTPTTSVALSPAQFIAAAVPGAQVGWRQYGVPASVTIAQAILESGWGRSSLSATDRNYFGIKCFNGNHGTLASGCHVYTTQECTAAGKCFTTSATFRTYTSMTNSFRDHGSFLTTNSRYKPAFTYTRDANKFIWNVWKAGYATDPNYYTKITGIMSANNLYRYDIWK